MSDEPPWKKIKLSLERPYKDDNGERIPVLLDISPEGEHFYEPKGDPSKSLGENLGRIFLERGLDFFERYNGHSFDPAASQILERNEPPAVDVDVDRDEAETDPAESIMTPQDLLKMRTTIIPQLYIALGEMTHAKELLALLLSSTTPDQPSSIPTLPPSVLTATQVSKPSPILSVQAFNAQLVVGGKDEVLRKAANIFKSAADSMERGRLKGEKYWVDALKIRRANWGLIPAPLPFGAATGKGADKTSKDFLVSFGLEESPSLFRRRAIGHLTNYENTTDALVFPQRQRTRLHVSLIMTRPDGSQIRKRNFLKLSDDKSLSGLLSSAQQEVVEQEIFTLLIKEASNLPTVSARVSERLIAIDAALGMELRFELMDCSVSDDFAIETKSDDSATCDLIFFALHGLLLRLHTLLKAQRLGQIGVVRVPGLTAKTPKLPVLQPIVDILQYQVFCERVRIEVDKVVHALSTAGIPSVFRFHPVGESGQELVRLFDEDGSRKIGGEATLRVDRRHTIRLTFISPSSLVAHLSQATLSISSIPQLVQLLSDEIEQYILNRICEVGSELCDRVSGTWFVDLVTSRCVGRWEGCILNYHIFFGEDSSICCSAHCVHGIASPNSVETYSASSAVPLLAWVQKVVDKSLNVP